MVFIPPAIVTFPPTYKLPTMPAPPLTWSAPVVVEEEDTVLFTYTMPLLKLTSPVKVLEVVPPPPPPVPISTLFI
jgi:hypothetical protein